MHSNSGCGLCRVKAWCREHRRDNAHVGPVEAAETQVLLQQCRAKTLETTRGGPWCVEAQCSQVLDIVYDIIILGLLYMQFVPMKHTIQELCRPLVAYSWKVP